jgi:lipopolysaccharide transport system permease protein
MRQGPGPEIILIDSARRSTVARLRESFSRRELLFFLAWRDVKVRYKQTIFGVAWAILQPILLALVFAFVFAQIRGNGAATRPKSVFYLSTLFAWTFFAQAVVSGSNSLVSDMSLVTKVYYPRVLSPIAAVFSYVVDLSVGLVLLCAIAIAAGVHVSVRWLLLLPAACWMLVLAAAVTVLFSAINVRYRDVRYALPFLVQLLMFVSPVAYSTSLVAHRWRWLYSLNPLVGALSTFRWIFLARGLSAGAAASGLIVTGLAMLVALRHFFRVERRFADVI